VNDVAADRQGFVTVDAMRWEIAAEGAAGPKLAIDAQPAIVTF
jgi:hypothetical protein